MRPEGEDAAESRARPWPREPNQVLLLWRLGLVVFLAAAAGLMHALSPRQVALPGIVGALGLMATTLAVAWAAAMARVPQRVLLALQLAADTLCIGLLVHFTGGPYSALPLVFGVPILLGAYFLGSRATMAIAGAAAAFTGGGHFGLALGWLLSGTAAELDYLQGWPVLVTALHMALFIFMGMIGGALARRLAIRRLQQARTDAQIQKVRCEVRNILDNIRSGLLTVDGQGLVTRVNPAACRILKATEPDLLGRSLAAAAGGALQPLARVVLPVAAGGPPVQRGEVQIRRGGGPLPLGLNVSPVTTSAGEVIGAIAIFTDLTREKEMSARMREADRLAAVGELAASIAHEIRNPLASIRGSIEIMAGELELDGHLGQLLSLVLKESARVNTIINDFLAYSRMRPAALRPLAGREFMQETSLLVRQHVAAHDGRVRVAALCEPAELRITADQSQLTQMVLNLAINACEAMQYRGELTLLLRQGDDLESCELEVSDNGPGIDPEIRDHLFDPFRTTKESGTGLGLSMVARIASAHGGRVRAADVPGGGARFTVTWPLQPPRSGQASPVAGESAADQPGAPCDEPLSVG